MSEIHCNVTANRAGQDYQSVKHWVRTVSDSIIAIRLASNRGTEWLLFLRELYFCESTSGVVVESLSFRLTVYSSNLGPLLSSNREPNKGKTMHPIQIFQDV